MRAEEKGLPPMDYTSILFYFVLFVLFYYVLYIMAYGLACDYVGCVVSEVFKPVKKTLRLLF
jgi:hypothetical protein